MTSPAEIQNEIERTRASLSAGVDRLSAKVSPGKAVGRRVDRVKSSARSVKERVMGVSDNAGQGVSSAADSMSSSAAAAGSSVASVAGSAKDALASAASQTGDLMSDAPRQALRQTQGNPIAAGLIAFGVGWLISTVLPPSQREQELAGKAEDKARELTEPLKDVAQQIAGNLQDPLQHAVDQVKSTAADAAQDTIEQARSAVDDVKAPLQEVSAEAHASSPAGGLARPY